MLMGIFSSVDSCCEMWYTNHGKGSVAMDLSEKAHLHPGKTLEKSLQPRRCYGSCHGFCITHWSAYNWKLFDYYGILVVTARFCLVCLDFELLVGLHRTLYRFSFENNLLQYSSPRM